MDEFSLTVEGITRTEYLQACRITARRLYGILAVSMVVICACIILATNNASVAALLGPLVVYIAVVAVYEVMVRVNYKGQLEQLENPMEYHFGPLGWTLRMGEEQAEIHWKATPKLKHTRDCLFLFNDDASSNILPRRLLTEEQIAKIEGWYRDTRSISKDYRKKQLRKERQEFKASHQNLKFGNRGPSWGPRKWRRK